MADSAIKALLDAARDAVRGLALSGIASDRVVALTVLTDAEKYVADLPAVLLAPYGAETYAPDTNLSESIGYPVAIVAVDAAGNDAGTADLDRRMRWRERIADLFVANRVSATLPTGCFLMTQSVEPFEAVNLGAWWGQQKFVSGLVVRFRCRRRRRAA